MPGVPYHVTQRGNRRGRVFFSDADRRAYLSWLRDYADKFGIEVLAYCLMDNHVHLVVVPGNRESLECALRPLHTRYAMRVNRAREWKGHLWQGRYFAAALDEPYLWAAVRYTERNPVRAGLVKRAEEFGWSSARAHCGLASDRLLSVNPEWWRLVRGVGDWSAWLAAGDETDAVDTLRQHVISGLPCGSETFLKGLEEDAGRPLRNRRRGRPKK